MYLGTTPKDTALGNLATGHERRHQITNPQSLFLSPDKEWSVIVKNLLHEPYIIYLKSLK